MGDAWDDSDDDWDNSDDDIDTKLNLNKVNLNSSPSSPPVFQDEEEDLTMVEKERLEKTQKIVLKTKGKALANKKRAVDEQKEEEELARRAVELEAEMEANMTYDERRALSKKREEEAKDALTDDLFGDGKADISTNQARGVNPGDIVKMTDLKDHLKHAKKVSQCIKGHGKTHLAAAFIKECIQESKDVLDDNAISDIIKICNVIKNEKVAAQKKKVKGQAQKSTKKRDKKEEAKAKKMAEELYGNNDDCDEHDEYGAQYEDDFF